MDTQQAVSSAQELVRTRPVFGEPVQADGVTILPATYIRGGAGGGDRADRSGAGFGIKMRPAGAFVARGGRVSWRPAIDVNRVILGGQLVAMVAIVSFAPLVRTRFGRRGLRAFIARWLG